MSAQEGFPYSDGEGYQKRSVDSNEPESASKRQRTDPSVVDSSDLLLEVPQEPIGVVLLLPPPVIAVDPPRDDSSQNSETSPHLNWDSVGAKTGKFSEEEDAILNSAIDAIVRENNYDRNEVMQYLFAGRGRNKKFSGLWYQIAAALPMRSLRQIYDHVRSKFDGNVKRGAWSPEEVDHLLELYEQHPNNWKVIAEKLNRLRLSCRDKYREVKGRMQWSKEDVNRLLEITDTYPPETHSWADIAYRMQNKSAEACRRKFLQLRPHHHTWRAEDDKRLFSWLLALAPDYESEINWTLLAEKFEGWSATQLYNIWQNHLKRIPMAETYTLPQLVQMLADEIDLAERQQQLGTIIGDEILPMNTMQLPPPFEPVT